MYSSNSGSIENQCARKNSSLLAFQEAVLLEAMVLEAVLLEARALEAVLLGARALEAGMVLEVDTVLEADTVSEVGMGDIEAALAAWVG